MRKASGAAFLVLSTTFVAGCGAPSVSDSGTAEIHEESGIVSLEVAPGFLSTRMLEPAALRGSFELPSLAASRTFDRVGVTWDSIEAGGATNFDVQVDGGAWLPVTVDFEEFVPESGLTLHAGHVDVPGGGASITPRASLLRGSVDEGPTMSPELTAAHLEIFDRAEIVESGTAIDPAAPPEVDPAANAALAAPAIVSRSDWGARAPKCEGATHSPYRLTFHHTETTNNESGAAARARMRQMQAFHQDTRGWCDIGYHFSVDWAGNIYQGRDTTGRTASHVLNQNSGNIGVSLMGGFEGSVTPPAAQLGGLEKIFAYEASKYGITVDGDHLRGHQQWPGQSTSCPGTNLLAKKTDILAAVRSILNGGTTTGGDTRPTVILDNAGSGFSASSEWWNSTSQADRYGANYAVRSTGSTSDLAEWKTALAAGKYEVFVWYSQGANRASAAPFFVYHSGGTTRKLIDEKTGGGRWASLGTYTFAAASSARVGLSCWTDTGTFVVADAVKLVPR